jgi:hypothetical protein
MANHTVCVQSIFYVKTKFLKTSPLYKIKKLVYNIKYVISLRPKTLFQMFLQCHEYMNMFKNQFLI